MWSTKKLKIEHEEKKLKLKIEHEEEKLRLRIELQEYAEKLLKEKAEKEQQAFEQRRDFECRWHQEREEKNNEIAKLDAEIISKKDMIIAWENEAKMLREENARLADLLEKSIESKGCNVTNTNNHNS
jgi:hypothetical protein